MNKTLGILAVTALAAVSGAALADDFPPFFPSGGAQTAPQQPGTAQGSVVQSGGGLHVTPGNTVTMQQGGNNPLLGTWVAADAQGQVILTFSPNGTCSFNIYNQQHFNAYCRTAGNTVYLSADPSFTGKVAQMNYTFNGNTINIDFEGQPITFQRAQGAGAMPPPQPVPGPGLVSPGGGGAGIPQGGGTTMPMPAPGGAALSGSYLCQVPANPNIQLRHDFVGNNYQVTVIMGQQQQPIEFGNFTFNGQDFNFTVVQSGNPQMNGSSGRNMIRMTPGGYSMYLQDGSVLNCNKIQ